MIKVTYKVAADQSAAVSTDDIILNVYGSSVNEKNEPILYLIRTEHVNMVDLDREILYTTNHLNDFVARKTVVEEYKNA